MNRKLKIALIIVSIPVVLVFGLICFSPAAYFLTRFIASNQYKQDLRDEIQATVNHILNDGQITGVLISDIKIK